MCGTDSHCGGHAAAEAKKPTTCCGKSEECVCAKEATCSCGAKPAMKCDCDKAATENTKAGERCSCTSRPAGQCNCSRAETENAKKAAASCACGADCKCTESGDGCNCGKNETDFTTTK